MTRQTAAVFLAALTATMLARPTYGQNVAIEEGLLCQQWLVSRDQRQSDDYEHYLIGLINGLRMANHVDFWHLKENLSRETVYLWMDNYCQQYPSTYLITGVLDLYEEWRASAAK